MLPKVSQQIWGINEKLFIRDLDVSDKRNGTNTNQGYYRMQQKVGCILIHLDLLLNSEVERPGNSLFNFLTRPLIRDLRIKKIFVICVKKAFLR